MGFFEGSYFSAESREHEGFSCFQERPSEEPFTEQALWSHSHAPWPANKNASKNTWVVENKDEDSNSEVRATPTVVSVENLLSSSSGPVSNDNSQQEAEGVFGPSKVKDESKGSKRFRRCSSHDNLATLYERNKKEVKKIARVPSAEVLTDRGIFLYPYCDYAKSHDHIAHYPFSKSKAGEFQTTNKSTFEKATRRRHSNGLPPSSSHYVKSERSEECSMESSGRCSLASHFNHRSEDVAKGAEKKHEEDERKSDTNSRKGAAEEYFTNFNTYYSTGVFQSATIAANELQSELKATEELLNSAARRKRYQDAWYSSTWPVQGAVFNDATNTWNPQSQPSAELANCSTYVSQSMAPELSVPMYLNRTLPNASQVASCVSGGGASQVQYSSYVQNGVHIPDATALTERNLQLEKLVVDLQMKLNELKTENAQLKMENQRLRQQVFQINRV